MNQPPRPVLPVWFLNAGGLAVVQARAKALRDYLLIRRKVREITSARGVR